MSKRNYKELWEQLKVIILCSGRRRWSQKDIFQTMTNLELMQLAQDPLGEILKVSKEVTK